MSAMDLCLSKKLESTYESSKMKSNGRLMLIFLFASNEEMRMVRMFPEYCCYDTTFGTNNEKKELFTLAFLDGNNHALNGGRAFVPSSQSWVFNTLFKFCLKTFWGEIVTDRLHLMITDGCTQEYLSFINNTGKNNAFPNAIHGLCYFHLVLTGWATHVKKHVPVDSGKIIFEFCLYLHG